MKPFNEPLMELGTHLPRFQSSEYLQAQVPAKKSATLFSYSGKPLSEAKLHALDFISTSKQLACMTNGVVKELLSAPPKISKCVPECNCDKVAPVLPVSHPPLPDLRLSDLNLTKPKPSVINKEALHNRANAVVVKNERARAISDLCKLSIRELRLMTYGERLFTFTGTYWQLVGQNDLIRHLRATDAEEIIYSLSGTEYKELYTKLLTDPTIYKEDSELLVQRNLIACTDGVYDLDLGDIREARPGDFLFSTNDFSISDIGRGRGKYTTRYLGSISDGDEQIVRQLLEIVGAILSTMVLKKLFLVYGPSNTGKSQFLNLCKSLVGAQNTATVISPNDFADRWTVGALSGKRLCVCGDIPDEVLTPKAIATMNQLTGHDPVKAELKYQQPFTMINEAKLLLGSNHVLKVPDLKANLAFMGRVVTIPFMRQIPESEWITDIYELLYDERGFIVGQAIDALADFRARNCRFSGNDTVGCEGDSRGLHPSSVSVVMDFVKERCRLIPEEATATADLHTAYCEYCEELEASPLALNVFGRTLNSQFKLDRDREAGGPNVRGFKGIVLNSKRGEEQ